MRPVSANVAFYASAAVYVNPSILMKPAKATLKTVSTLRSVIERSSFSVIFSRIPFEIGRRFHFLLGNSFLPPLMISAIRGSPKPPTLRRLLIWYDFKAERKLRTAFGFNRPCLGTLLLKIPVAVHSTSIIVWTGQSFSLCTSEKDSNELMAAG